MSRVLQAVRSHAELRPDHIAFEGKSTRLSYAELSGAIDAASAAIGCLDIRVAALLADNTPAWAMTDLALLQAGIPLVPIPHFFTAGQTGHLIHSAGVDAIFTDQPEQTLKLLHSLNLSYAPPEEIGVGGQSLFVIRLPAAEPALPDACAKVTFTSGSTGEPRGVCLKQSAMEAVAASLAEATRASEQDRHVSLLPYTTLLENVGGLYTPLLAGATICAPGLAAVGMTGASSLDARTFVTSLISSKASSCIMIPQMLYALVTVLEAGMPKPEALRFIAVGGAHVSGLLLQRATTLGLPVYEGYGLSEAASVVSVNKAGANRPGSAGKPLGHVEIRFAVDGEILVRGSLFSGYLGEPEPAAGGYWPTGDLGYLDTAGFLHLNGRKKHIFITAFGRNVSPEWIECELAVEAAIAQCCVFGEARPFNIAVIQPRQGFDAGQVHQAVDKANVRLPDYARISRWLPAHEPFTVANGMWTGTGRPIRQKIFETYAEKMNELYNDPEEN